MYNFTYSQHGIDRCKERGIELPTASTHFSRVGKKRRKRISKSCIKHGYQSTKFVYLLSGHDIIYIFKIIDKNHHLITAFKLI